MNKTHQFKENHYEKIAKISIWPFLLTDIHVPDTSIDQAHMQLSKSYVIAYADSSSNGIIWNIETSLGKSSPCEVLEDQKRKMFFFGKRCRKVFIYFDGVRVWTFSFLG